MFQFAKPYIGPAALFAFERGLDWAGVNVPPLVAGILLGFAAFWLFFALVSHKELVKKYPTIRQWLPFVDPLFSVRPSSKELSGMYISKQVFSIADIAHENTVRGRTLEDCDIYGPAVVHITNGSVITDCGFGAPEEATYINTNQQHAAGVIVLDNCVIRRCRLFAIGIIRNIPPAAVAPPPN